MHRVRSLWIATVIALLVCFPAVSRAGDDEGACGAAFDAWATACGAGAGIVVSTDHCGDGVAVVRTVADGETGRVEIAPQSRGQTFDRVGTTGLSPIGNFTDWSAAPPGVRRGFDVTRTCVARGAMPPFRRSVRIVERQARWTWRMSVGLAALIAWLALVASAPKKKARLAEAAIAASTMAVALIFRRLAMGPAFFHQNGHGGFWVQIALCQPSEYGPGYHSLFFAPARIASAHAERGVFVAQEILALLAVAAVYAIGRGLGVSRRTAWVGSIAIALEPLLGRLARSESYYASALSLCVLACAAFLAPGLRSRVRDRRAWIGAAVGGMLLAMAVTIHPVAWVPCAIVPSVVLLRVGSRRDRIVTSLASAAIVGVCVAAFSLSTVLGVLHGTLGAQWQSSTPSGGRLALIALLVLAPWIAGLALPHRIARWIVPLAILVAASRLARYTVLFGELETVAPARAWRWLFAVTAIAATAAYVARVESRLHRVRGRLDVVVPAALALVAVVNTVTTFRASTTLPTDSLEATRFAPWLQSLPLNGRLVYLGRAGLMNQELPVYNRCIPGIEVVSASNDHAARLEPGDYWFRSATCATSQGRRACDEMEQRVHLRTIHEERFPARQSMRDLPYDTGDIVSGLYHVEALREP